MHTTFFIFHYIPEFNVLQAHDKLLKRERKKKTRPVNITASLFHIHLNELLRKIVKFFRNLIYERVHMDECKKKLLNFHANKWKLNFYVGGIEFWEFFSFPLKSFDVKGRKMFSLKFDCCMNVWRNLGRFTKEKGVKRARSLSSGLIFSLLKF